MKRFASLFFFLAMSATFAQAQTIRYVKPVASGAGDGSSWADASADLQAMIDASAANDEVWVAAGTYKPTAGTDRTISFYMKDGVAIYGGFAGAEALLDDRDWAVNETILSGDIGVVNDSTDNSYHVIFNQNIDNTALLDGFTIRDGNADGLANIERRGAGMYNQSSSPGISHCQFSDNSALFNGGGLYNQDSHPAVSHCTFSNNTAGAAGGGVVNNGSSAAVFIECAFSSNSSGNLTFDEGAGGVLNSGGAAPVFDNCTFTGNTSEFGGGGMRNINANPILNDCTFSQNISGGGGGMLNQGASPILANCVFSQNTGFNGGGGMTNFSGSSPVLNNCSFISNTAFLSFGGGMNNSDSSPTLNDCTFTGNNAGSGGGIAYSASSGTLNRCIFTSNTAFVGGGIFFSFSSDAVLNQCLFAGNAADNSGGGVRIQDSSPSLTNCQFIGNTSTFGGGLSFGGSGAPVLKNCSMSGNSAFLSIDGGAIYTFSTNLSLVNCILWGNSSGIDANPGIFANVSHSIVQQGSGVYPGTGNLNLDPLFVSQPPIGLGTAGDLHLQACSPAVDLGTNSGAPGVDYDDQPRPFNSYGLSEALTDMGAFEYQQTQTPATPSVTISGPAETSCVGITYTASPVNGGLSPFYNWMVNGVAVGIHTSTFTTTNLSIGDVVNCEMSSTEPCAYPLIATSNSITITQEVPPPGDPAVFGDNEWRVYAWNAGGATPTSDSWNTDYRGYYTTADLNFNSQNQWNSLASPSSAPGYQGCLVGDDNHSWSAKRRGFTCGYYKISVTGHDDAAQLWIDGAMVWEFIGCCQSHPNVWEGFLDADSEVEFRVTEGEGASRGSLSFQQITAQVTQAGDLCDGGSATLALANNPVGNYLWSTGETTSSITIINAGTYSVTLSGSNGCSISASTDVFGPAGDPAVFGDNVWNVYAWNAGGETDTGNSWNTHYAGYYTDANLNFNSTNYWGAWASPSSASGYQGCPVNADNHSWSAKRKGLPCGYYQINVTSHDDYAQLWVDGVMVWDAPCCSSQDNVWTGFLDASSEVEFRVTEGLGNSNGSIVLQPLTPSLTGLNDLCSSSPATLAVQGNPAGDYLWSTGESTPSILITEPGTYSVTLDNGNGCSISAS
ncbi:MAG: right-handed parallel beta-helix repeat-containing protein, partial [Saprospiraceae bacterium]|nr:right-handed parallel beta-helix repeat-containing protein [Saprospiraceae bacterium]